MPTSATYSHGHHASVTRAHATRSVADSAAYLVPHLAPGLRILDVGCGPGSITVDLAGRVGPTGHVTGIDASAEVIEQARQLAADQGVTNVTFEVGDAYAVSHPDSSFDIVHAHQVLQHLSAPVDALSEWRRLAAGMVAVREVIYSATTVYPFTAELLEWRRLAVELIAHNGGQADAGSHLKAWFRAAGAQDVETDVETWCFESDEDRRWWGEQWAERVLASSFSTGTQQHGLATDQDRQAISDAWRHWADDPDGWMVMVHGWVIDRIGSHQASRQS